jgi:regulator of RNase E activity RraA
VPCATSTPASFGFAVHARGTVPSTARGRIVQEAWNVPVRLGNAPVRPGDVIVADVNGVVVVPIERLAEVVEAAEQIMAKELAMLDALRAGESILEVGTAPCRRPPPAPSGAH